MASDRRNHHHLPEDLINEILLRLPVKSLLRSKSVCKSWYLRIKSPEFINNHFHHSNNHGGLLVHRYIKDLSKRAFEFFPDKSLGLSCLDPYMQDAAPVDKILGPLNGIFLLFNRPDRSALWNPATRELKPLPPVPPSISRIPYFEHFKHSFGLGLDPLTNSYKVIWIIWRIIWKMPRAERDEPIFALVYTRGNDSWRKLQLEGNTLNFSHYDVYQSLCYTYLDGVYYWRVDVYNSPVGIYTAILSFNMEDEVFREIQAPYIQCPDNTEFSDPNLALYKDRLAMFLYNPRDPEISAETMSIEIWVMETVGCWSKQLTIGPFSQVVRVCGFWNNNEVFLETNSLELILCDPTRNQEMREIGPRRRGNLVLVLSYKESLFSIMG